MNSRIPGFYNEDRETRLAEVAERGGLSGESVDALAVATCNDWRALVSEGIQAGHMKLHTENVAAQAGAPADLVKEIAARMVAEGDVRESRAKELRDELS